MKKLSKVHKQMRETIGIDLGDKLSRYCIVDQNGEVVEEGDFRNQVSWIEKHFGDRPRRIALEAGAQSAWISGELQRLGHEVIVANPRDLKWITASDTNNDPPRVRLSTTRGGSSGNFALVSKTANRATRTTPMTRKATVNGSLHPVVSACEKPNTSENSPTPTSRSPGTSKGS